MHSGIAKAVLHITVVLISSSKTNPVKLKKRAPLSDTGIFTKEYNIYVLRCLGQGFVPGRGLSPHHSVEAFTLVCP